MFHQTALVFLCISVIYLKMWSLTWQQYFIIKCLESWILSTVRSNPVSLAHWVFLYIWVCLATSVLPVLARLYFSLMECVSQTVTSKPRSYKVCLWRRAGIPVHSNSAESLKKHSFSSGLHCCICNKQMKRNFILPTAMLAETAKFISVNNHHGAHQQNFSNITLATSKDFATSYCHLESNTTTAPCKYTII